MMNKSAQVTVMLLGFVRPENGCAALRITWRMLPWIDPMELIMPAVRTGGGYVEGG
jgi:hypothetical protein